MSSLRDALAAQPVMLRGPACRVAIAREMLSPENAAELTAAIANRTIETSRLARVLRDMGAPWVELQLSEQTLRRHRRGDCSCPKAA